MSRSSRCCPEINYPRTDGGTKFTSLTVTPTVGPDSAIVLDSQSIEIHQRFDRERIPERVVHAKGSGAFGTFKCTNDLLEKVTDAVVFKHKEETPVAVRFSTVIGGAGSADTVRNPRGFAVKFYSRDGNWDLTGNNTPVFFIRDPILFPEFIHSQKPGKDGLISLKRQYDFFGLRPETYMQNLFMLSERGIPDGFRHMDGFGSHTFVFHKTHEKGNSSQTFVKFRWISQQGLKNLPPEEAAKIAGTNPDHDRRDLLDAIVSGNYPKWTLSVQLISSDPRILKLHDSIKDLDSVKVSITDVTKTWPTTIIPEIHVGTMILNRVPSDFFSEIEQIAFCPGNFVDGIGPSNDRMLLMRTFSYRDTQLHRIGANFMQLPVNFPRVCPFNYNHNGPMVHPPQCCLKKSKVACSCNCGDSCECSECHCESDKPETCPYSTESDYFPNSNDTYVVSEGNYDDKCNRKVSNLAYPHTATEVGYYDTKDNDNYSQPDTFYRMLPREQKKSLILAIVADLRVVLNDKTLSSQVSQDTPSECHRDSAEEQVRKKQDFSSTSGLDAITIVDRFLFNLQKVNKNLYEQVQSVLVSGSFLPHFDPELQHSGLDFMRAKGH